MRRIALFDKKGMTLIEVMIATFLFLIIALALLQTSIISVDHNVMSSLRENATSVAEARMNDARNVPFANLVSDPGVVNVNRNIANATITFSTDMTVTPLGDNAKQITIKVDWKWKGAQYSHSISSIVRGT